MRTEEQNNKIFEYLEVSEMHLLDGCRLVKLDEAKKGIEDGYQRHGELMAMVGLASSLNPEPSVNLLKKEMKIVIERRRIYFKEIKGLFEDLKRTSLDIETKKRLDSHYSELVKNQESDNEIKI